MPDDSRDPVDARWRDAMSPLAGSAEPSAALEARVRASLDTQRGRTTQGKSRRAWMALAAVALLAVTGILLRLQPWNAPAAGPRYLLLLYEGGRFSRGNATHEQLVAEYSAWAGGLAKGGKLVDASELGEEEQLVSGAGEATRGPAGVIAGFFIVRAADMREATAIAATSPHLKYGGEVAVRPLR